MEVAHQIGSALIIYSQIVLPALLAAVVVGLIVAILQAATQIQDQTLPQTMKILAVMGVFAVMTSALTAPLITFAKDLFTRFPILVN
ncbi:MAG: flagellar biosynthetic protein FliQ [Pseudomonadota bacterium]